jgi:hypothetical protein
MADIVRHPAAVPAEWIGDPELEAETRVLIAALDYEIGRRWMSVELRLQIEKIEVLIGERGTAPTF